MMPNTLVDSGPSLDLLSSTAIVSDVQKRLLPSDGGPLYAETNLSSFPVEPWNTYSEVAVLLVALFWLRVFRKAPKRRSTLGLAIVLLSVQWLGATLYHALRTHPFWLVLDVLPILLFTFLLVFVSLNRTSRHSYQNGVVTVIVTAAIVVLIIKFPSLNPWPSSGAYFFLMCTTLTVLISEILTRRGERSKAAPITLLLLSLSFALALSAREVDSSLRDFLPMGTHFIWHLLAALTAHLLLFFDQVMTQKSDTKSVR